MQKPEIRMNENVAKYGDTKGCLSRFCSGKKPPDNGSCSSYSCHYSRDFKPGDVWKFYYRQQKLQQYGHQKHQLLQRLGRHQDKDVMQCVVNGLRVIEDNPPPPAVPYDFGPDFFVRPWQQQFIPPLQDPPCPVHGFDKPPQKNICSQVRNYPPHCSRMVHCCEPCLQNVCSQPRRGPFMVNPLLKYKPEQAFVIQPCQQLPHTRSFLGVPQPYLQQDPPRCVPQFCCSEKQVKKKEWPDINDLWRLR